MDEDKISKKSFSIALQIIGHLEQIQSAPGETQPSYDKRNEPRNRLTDNSVFPQIFNIV